MHKLITRARSNQQLLLHLLRLLLTFWGSRAAPVSEVRLNNMGLDVCARGFVVYFRSLFIGPDPKCDSLARKNS